MSIYRHYTIKQDENIRQIAYKLYRDMDKWKMLVNLNNLRYPYIVKSFQEKANDPAHLLTYGDDLLLPNDEGQEQRAEENKIKDSNTKHYAPKYYDMVMGTDIKLDISTDTPLPDQTGILVADGRDLQTVSGLENLKQSLINRILTPYGTLYMHPRYGSHLPEILGKSMNQQLLSDAVVELKRTLTTDERVQQVKVKKNVLTYDTIYLVATITPITYNDAFNIYLYRSEQGDFSIR